MIKEVASYLYKGGFSFLMLCLALVLNHRTGYITLIGIFSIIVFFSYTVREKIDKGGLVILLYTTVYILFSFLNGFPYTFSTLILYAVAPFIFYQYGKIIVRNFSSETFIITSLLLIVFCYCVDIYYTLLQGIIESGQLLGFNRKFSLSGDSENMLSATLVGLSMNIGMIGLPMTILIKNKILKLSFFSLFIMSIITTFSLLNRTGIAVALFCFFGIMSYKSRFNLRYIVYSFIFIVLIVLGLSYLEILNTDLLEIYAERNNDISTMGSRTDRWSEALKSLLVSPAGWESSGKVYYVHNMWLDIARISGIIPFSLLVYMAFDCFMKAFKIIKINESNLGYMLLGLNICFFLSCFVEPIFGGTHFMLYCLVWGVECAVLRNKEVLYS